MSIWTERFPRLLLTTELLRPPFANWARRVRSPNAGGSTFVTSAPRSLSSMHASGPAMTCVMSMTLIPSSGPGISVSLSSAGATLAV